MTETRLVAALILVFAAVAAWACEDSVRDAAFRNKRDMHRLCVIANRGDAQADRILGTLTSWLDNQAKELNVKLERVVADDPAVSWKDYGIPSAPQQLPVVALIGEVRSQRRSFVIDHWEPSPTPDDLAAVLNSPARQAIKERVGGLWAVVLYSPTAVLYCFREKAILFSVLAISSWSMAKFWLAFRPG